MASIPSELIDLYTRYFGKSPVVVVPSVKDPINNVVGLITPDYSPTLKTKLGSTLQENYLGVDIWLPVRLVGLPADIGENGTFYLPYVTVRINATDDWIETPLNQRRGTAKELYALGDYRISIRGFFIDKTTRTFPEDDLVNLKKVRESGQMFGIDNAITNIFLGSPLNDQSDRVILKSFDLQEVTGGRKNVRPFSMELLTDSIFTLEWK